MAVKLIAKKGSTFHDFPYSHPERKCFHCWIINVTPPGPNQCIHSCIYCYAREAIYSSYAEDTLIYCNLPELVERDLRKLALCPPISLSNISDPCQDIPELKKEVTRLIRLLMDYNVAFFITTKGDPSFLLEVPGFAEYKLKFIAITIEGTEEILRLLSPRAPSFAARIACVSRMSGLGIDTVVRLDPLFIHLFQAVHTELWWDKLANLIGTFANAGAKHVTVSTGRLSKKRSVSSAGCDGASTWQRLEHIILEHSPLLARKFSQEYVFEQHWSGGGYRLRKDLRLNLHRRLRELVEASGMTYASCQELSAEESDTYGIPHCEGIRLPFCVKQPNGKFVPLPHCTANCHVFCRGLACPPCGRPELISFRPLRFHVLCVKARQASLASGSRASDC